MQQPKPSQATVARPAGDPRVRRSPDGTPAATQENDMPAPAHDELLDYALAATFPASDPLSVTQPGSDPDPLAPSDVEFDVGSPSMARPPQRRAVAADGAPQAGPAHPAAGAGPAVAPATAVGNAVVPSSGLIDGAPAA
jgi:hypothetical protein